MIASPPSFIAGRAALKADCLLPRTQSKSAAIRNFVGYAPIVSNRGHGDAAFELHRQIPTAGARRLVSLSAPQLQVPR
jgi:hypothetical protein